MYSSTLSGMLVAAGYISSAVPVTTALKVPQDPRPAMPTSTATPAPPNFLDCVVQRSEIRLLLAGGCAMDVKEVNKDFGTRTLTSDFPIGPARTSYQQQIASIASVTPTASPAVKRYSLADCVAQVGKVGTLMQDRCKAPPKVLTKEKQHHFDDCVRGIVSELVDPVCYEEYPCRNRIWCYPLKQDKPSAAQSS
ncbi:hypothetical protein LTR95_001637 [Oleoguttula sp. CCFEE 5521]